MNESGLNNSKDKGSDIKFDEVELQRQVNKRLSLNLLIQGAAALNYMTGHHLVKDELESLEPGVVRLYDEISAYFELSLWRGIMTRMFGTSKKFWTTIEKKKHPFAFHPFLRKHGYALSKEAKANAVGFVRKRNLTSIPVWRIFKELVCLFRILGKEVCNENKLERLAIKATSKIWGIDQNRMDASLTTKTKFGNVQPNPTKAGKKMQDRAMGYSGIVNQNGKLNVVAKAWNFPLLIHELSKGVAELVCAHGLNQIEDDEFYKEVVEVADKIEYEIWMMQSGSVLWKKFLKAKTGEFPLAETLMHVSMLEPEVLEAFMFDLVEHPMTARATVADWFDE